MFKAENIKHNSIIILGSVLISLIILLLLPLKLDAAVSNEINYQSRILFTSGTIPACIVSGSNNDTCDFKVSIWSGPSGSDLMYQELFTNIEIEDDAGIFKLVINSVCQATPNGNHQWAISATSSALCILSDDSADSDSITGVNFNRDNLYLSITFDPSGTWTDLASPPGGLEEFSRTPLVSVPMVFAAQTLGGFSADGFVRLSPPSIQNTNSSTAAIWVNNNAGGNVLQLQVGGVNKVTTTFTNIFNLLSDGTSGGLLLDNTVNLYRSASNTLATNADFIISLNLTQNGLSQFEGDLRNLLTDGDASSTTSGSGTSSKLITLASTSNFNIGNLILINGTTYARIDSVLNGTELEISPAVSWGNGQTVVEKTASKIGGDGSNLTYSFDKIYSQYGLQSGVDSSATQYRNQLISTTDSLAITGKTGLNATANGGFVLANSSGLIINKSPGVSKNTYWSEDITGGGSPRYDSVSVLYNGKIYNYSGMSGGSPTNTLDIYDIQTNTWTTGTTGGTVRTASTAVLYNGKMYVWGGTSNNTAAGAVNTIYEYDIAGNSWIQKTTGGTARYGHSAAQYNGKIYFYGGWNSAGTILNTLDIYDIAGNSWSTGTTSITRTLHTAAVYNGKMYVWGGISVSAAINTMNIYDIAGNSWSAGVTGGTARVAAKAKIYNNKMYIWGGCSDGACTVVFDTTDVYDFINAKWESSLSSTVGRVAYVVETYQNKIYFLKGSKSGSTTSTFDVLVLPQSSWSTGTSGQPVNANTGILYQGKIYYWGSFYGNTVRVYDIDTDTWSTKSSGGTSRFLHCSTQYNGKIYIFGGFDNLSNKLNTLDIYDIATDTWTTGPNGDGGRTGCTAEVANNKMYIVGGSSAADTYDFPLSVYNLLTNTWESSLTNIVINRGNHSSVVYNNRIYAWGGWSGAGVLNTMDIIDLKTLTYTKGPTGGTARQFHTTVVYDNKMYAWGGLTNVNINVMDVFDFATNTWSLGESGGTAKQLHTSVVYNGKMYAYGGWDGSNPMSVMDIYDFGKRDVVLQVNVGSQEKLRLDSNNVLTVSGQALGLKYTGTENNQYASFAWSTRTAGGTARVGIKTILHNGKIYSWAGATNAARSTLTNTMAIYDIATDTWGTGTTGGTARYSYGAALVNNKIYYWGGCTNAACSTVLNTLDIYDISANSWTTGATGGTARGWITLEHHNGKLYSWGGFNGSANINTTDIYDIAGNSWSTGANGVAAKREFSSVVYDGRIYYWGGFTTAVVQTINIYNIAGNSWTSGTAGGTARRGPSSIVYKGRMYGWGGFTTVAVNTMSIYDFASDIWMTGQNTGGISRRWHDSVLFNDKIYSWGGEDGTNVLDSVDVFDFNGVNTYSTATPGGTSRFNFIAISYKDKAYIWGGYTNVGRTTLTNTIDIYNFKTDSWSTGTAGGTARGFYVAHEYNGKIYYLTGCNGSSTTCTAQALSSVDIYDIEANSWSTGASGGTARGLASSVLYNGKIYIWAGRNNAGTLINTLDIYDIASNSWSTGLAGGTARQNAMTVLYRGRMINWAGFTTANINTTDIYNIDTNTWSTGANGVAAKRDNYQSVVYNGLMIHMGGFVAAAVNTVDIYDIDRNVWQAGPAGGLPRFSGGTVVYGNKLYYFFGNDATNMFNSVEILTLGIAKADDVFTISNGSSNDSAGSKLFRFDATGRAYTSDQGGWFSVGADYAEYMQTNDQSIEAGDIIKLNLNDGKKIEKASAGDSAIGVISTSPGFVGNIQNIDDINNGNPNWKLVSMVGQVPVKVTNENGEIKVGDRITVSSISGVGMKSDEGGFNIGIAQDYYNSSSIGIISVLLTRNNEGINNKVQLTLGKEGEAGFRVSTEGKLQFRNKDSEWIDFDERDKITNALLWHTTSNDNIQMLSYPRVLIGVSESDVTDSTLQVNKSIESKKGLNFIKIDAEGAILFNSNEFGIRINTINNSLEFKDSATLEWTSLSGLLISRLRFDNGVATEVKNQVQYSGWGYLTADGINNVLTDTVMFPAEFVYNPFVNVGSIGQSSNVPQNINDCSENNLSGKISVSEVSKSSFKINFKVPVETEKYYCYTWLAN